MGNLLGTSIPLPILKYSAGTGYDWTLFGLPMAQLVGIGAAVAAIVAILIRHWWVRRHPAAADGGATQVAAEPTEPSESAESAEPATAAGRPTPPTHPNHLGRA